MSGRLFPYLTPLIYPVFPKETGEISVGLNLQRVLDGRAAHSYDGPLSVDIELFSEGERTHFEQLRVGVTGGRLETQNLTRWFVAPTFGYAQISISVEEPLFWDITVPVGYANLRRPGFGTVNVIGDQKFANPIVIKQIESIGKFCLVHVACLSDSRAGIGNSLLAVNPYDKAVVAQIRSSPDRAVKRRVPAKSVALVPLAPLLDDGRVGSIMVTGNNRFPAWDVRHAYDDPLAITNIDHFEIYRGYDTHERVGAVPFMRALARRQLMKRGLRIS